MSGYIPGPSGQDINEMQRLIDIMNGNSGGYAAQGGPSSPQQQITETRRNPNAPMSLPPAGPGPADTEAMRKVLESFYGAAGDAVSTLAEEAANDYQHPHLQEAMETRVTDHGVAIGKWEVRVRVQENATGQSRKLYDVLNPATREVVAEKLVVYEAAHAIVRFLNKGLNVNNGKVQEVLELEEKFHRTRQEAARFKQRFDRCVQLGEKEAADVFEARYQTARAHALVASDQIKSILDSIR
jgi:hypothetical protein